MTKFDKKAIMTKAWELFKANRYGTFATCLKLAWEEAKGIKAIADEYGTIRTWYGWTLFGREVIHGQKNIGQVNGYDPKTITGKRMLSFFTFEQTCELGTQPPKAV